MGSIQATAGLAVGRARAPGRAQAQGRAPPAAWEATGDVGTIAAVDRSCWCRIAQRPAGTADPVVPQRGIKSSTVGPMAQHAGKDSMPQGWAHRAGG